MNDLQFLTGPSVADIDGRAGEEVLAGSAHDDLRALDEHGSAVSSAWPKLTADWMVSNPAIGSFGVDELDPSARKSVVALTRAGTVFAYRTDAPACSPGSWPRFHHDAANSGDLARDAALPGRPWDGRVAAGTLTFRAPGDDLLCGRATAYERSVDGGPWERVDGAQPGAAGALETMPVPRAAKRQLAVRAIDDQGNAGRPLEVPLRKR
jgi:hypothetical protein